MGIPSTKGLLKSILSDDIERVFDKITDKAVEWAVAGFVVEANILLEKLWEFDITHAGNSLGREEGLQVMWTLSNKFPTHIPFTLRDLNDIEKENWSKIFYPYGSPEILKRIVNKSFTELNGIELFIKAINSVYDQSENIEAILDGLKRFTKTDQAAGHPYFHATTAAALLAARNNLSVQAEYFIKLWGEGYLEFWSNYNLASLMSDRNCGAYLLTGILAPVFDLTHEKIQGETRGIIDTLAFRVENGRTLAYKELSWKQLLEEISRIAIEHNTYEFSENNLKEKSLRQPPATKEEIQEAEKRLNIVLPDDYKNFLITSNGFDCFSITGVTLAAVAKIDFLINFDESLVDFWTESLIDDEPTFVEKFRKSIIIGGHGEEQQLLLIPLQNNRWECWRFANWIPGEEIYESFRFYMEYELQSLEDDI